MKKILLDQGLSPVTAELLRNEGWDSVHVQEIGLADATDPAILERARVEGRVCVTLDHDFHAHLALTSANAPSVVEVAVTVSSRSIRLRRLPLP